MNPYFDRSGQPISMYQYGLLRRNPSYYRITAEWVGTLWVSTVWIGIDLEAHVFEDQPRIFETMVFDGGSFGSAVDEYTRHYPTEDDARTGHTETVAVLNLDLMFHT